MPLTYNMTSKNNTNTPYIKIASPEQMHDILGQRNEKVFVEHTEVFPTALYNVRNV